MVHLKSFGEVNEFLSQFLVSSGKVYNRDNMFKLMKRLGNPQNKLQIIHIAGTSGKSSTAYYLSALLTSAKCKTGLVVSPSVTSIAERVQINGAQLSESQFCREFSTFAMNLEGLSFQPSWFEVIVAFAYWYFEIEKVEYAVIEVGLGGLDDATNVISREDKVCVITDIGFDHMDQLGKTIKEITSKKAGIIQNKNEVFVLPQDDEVMDVIINTCQLNNAKLHPVIIQAVKSETLPQYQLRNWTLAYEAFRFLTSRDNIKSLNDKQALLAQSIKIPGRMEVININNLKVVFDGAHNPQKMEALVATLKSLDPDNKPAVLIAMKPGKAYEEVAEILGPYASAVITTEMTEVNKLPIKTKNKSVSAQALAKAFSPFTFAQAISDQRAALNTALKKQADYLLVTGSIHFIGQIKTLLKIN